MTPDEHKKLLEHVQALEALVKSVANDRLMDREVTRRALEAMKGISAAVTLLLDKHYRETPS